MQHAGRGVNPAVRYNRGLFPNPVERLYERRASQSWTGRLSRLLEPPRPLILNPNEPMDFPLGRWNLYIGGGGSEVRGYINLDLFPLPGVTPSGFRSPAASFSAWRAMRFWNMSAIPTG